MFNVHFFTWYGILFLFIQSFVWVAQVMQLILNKINSTVIAYLVLFVWHSNFDTMTIILLLRHTDVSPHCVIWNITAACKPY